MVMEGPMDPEIAGELKKYLQRKRSEGIRVVHVIGGEAADKTPPAKLANVEESGTAASPVKARTVEEAGITPVPAHAAVTEAAGETHAPARAAAVDGENTNSIRFTYRPECASQASLFGGGGGSGRPGLEKLDIESLERRVSQCTLCDLHGGRTHTVFGCGNPRAKIIFIGEAPGREEDLQGIPFVGRAGKLLDKMLASVELERDDVYIANILKCRPPNNRDPSEEESSLCKPYLWRQIELINPAVICALGRVAGQNLLETKASLGTLRDGEHYCNDIRVLVTYHPAALLRNPHWKRAAWEDIKKAKRLYDEAKG